MRAALGRRPTHTKFGAQPISAPGDPLPSSTITATLLLEGLKDPANARVWQEYVDRYRPLIVRYAQRLGVAAMDADDVAQQTLLTFCSAYRAGKYDRERGRLRTWLFTIAHSQIMNWRRAGRARAVHAGSDLLANLPDADDSGALWEEEWRDAVLRECLSRIRNEVSETTFEAFRRFVLEERSAKDVAAELGTSQNAVFLAKRRVLERVRQLMPGVEETW